MSGTPLKLFSYDWFHHMPKMGIFIFLFFHRDTSGLILPQPEDAVKRIEAQDRRSIAPSDPKPPVIQPLFFLHIFRIDQFLHLQILLSFTSHFPGNCNTSLLPRSRYGL